METRPKILVVDDKPPNLFAMEKLLRALEVEVVQTTSGAEALALALEQDFCVAIVDVQMPEIDGYELVELLRGNESTATLPVIFVSAIFSDEYHHRKGYEAGAVDFMSKPFIPEILISKVQVFIDLYRQRRKLQQVIDELDRANSALTRRAIQLETSAQVGRQVTGLLDLDALLKEVVSLVQARFGYYFVGVWLWNEARDGLTLQAASGGNGPLSRAVPAISCDAEQSIIAHVCRTRQIYFAADVQADDLYLPLAALPKTRSEIALPLEAMQELFGVLDIQNRQTNTFTSKDIQVLQIMADQIAIAIRNAQLYSQVVCLNQELEDRVRQRTAELEKAYRELELLDRNKSDFIQVIAHELRTPLTLIRGYSQMMLEDPDFQECGNYQQQVNGIVSGADRMHGVVNSMLDMVRIESGAVTLDFQTIQLSELIDPLRSSLARVLARRRLTFTLAPGLYDLPPVEVDLESIHKLFEQLLLNAIKYTPDGGEISVSGQVVQALVDDPDSQAVEIVISDNGIGIAPEFQDLIFTKFYQTERAIFHSSGKTKFKGGGPGLGLAIARGIVGIHNGRIWVESPGYDETACPGSRFHVLLPLRQERVALLAS
ncbi:MAG: response regulator [Anaerolineae bacterium]|jgi:signal transduction histidine kinase/CheY-like chemotaxis protein